MKEELKAFLTGLGHQVHDFGTNSEDPVDYPDLAYAVARSVAEGSSELGIVIDGAGVGQRDDGEQSARRARRCLLFS